METKTISDEIRETLEKLTVLLQAKIPITDVRQYENAERVLEILRPHKGMLEMVVAKLQEQP